MEIKIIEKTLHKEGEGQEHHVIAFVWRGGIEEPELIREVTNLGRELDIHETRRRVFDQILKLMPKYE